MNLTVADPAARALIVTLLALERVGWIALLFAGVWLFLRAARYCDAARADFGDDEPWRESLR